MWTDLRSNPSKPSPQLWLPLSFSTLKKFNTEGGCKVILWSKRSRFCWQSSYRTPTDFCLSQPCFKVGPKSSREGFKYCRVTTADAMEHFLCFGYTKRWTEIVVPMFGPFQMVQSHSAQIWRKSGISNEVIFFSDEISPYSHYTSLVDPQLSHWALFYSAA